MDNRTKHVLAYIIVTTILFIILYISLQGHPPFVFRDARMKMGTIVEITIYDSKEDDAISASDEAFREIDRLEKIFSSYRMDSEISRINLSAGKGPVRVSEEVVYVINKALMIARMSGGAFDPTVGILGRLWSFSGDYKKGIPTRKQVDRLLKLVNYKAIIIDERKETVALDREGMRINLGGIAKGYIVGRAAAVLKNNGIKRAIVKAGGDMVVFDKGKGDRPFKIGIKHPRKLNKLIAQLTVSNKAVATSGDYERYAIINGKRYHHILDPFTGFPAERSRAVTIVSDDPTIADALSTAVFVMGYKKGIPLLEGIEGAEGLIIDSRGVIHLSSGLKQDVTINPD